MREKNIYPIMLIGASAVSVVLWIGVVIYIGPDELGALGIVLFLAAFGFAIFSSLLVCFYYIHMRRAQTPFRVFHRMFRESGLITGVVIIYLFLSHFGAGTFTNLFILLGIGILVDVFCIVYYDQRRRAKISEH